MVKRTRKTKRSRATSPSLEFVASLAVSDAAKKNIVAAIFILLFIAVLVYILMENKKNRNEKKQGKVENIMGNVGGGGIYEIDLSTIKKGMKNNQLCYTDVDCPDQTFCGPDGQCIPRILSLPQSRHLMKLGLGRENEVNTK